MNEDQTIAADPQTEAAADYYPTSGHLPTQLRAWGAEDTVDYGKPQPFWRGLDRSVTVQIPRRCANFAVRAIPAVLIGLAVGLAIMAHDNTQTAVRPLPAEQAPAPKAAPPTPQAAAPIAPPVAPRPVAQPPAPPPLTASDRYDLLLEKDGMVSDGTPADDDYQGHRVCQEIANGADPNTLAAGGDDVDAAHGTQAVRDAITVYCPQYGGN